MLATNLALAQKYNYLEEKFVKSFAWLKENDIKSLADGRYDIAPGVFAFVQRYNTVPFAEQRFEAHNDYFDIQYLADGIESFNVAPRAACSLTTEDLKNDVVFFAHPEHYSSVTLEPGDFVIVPPEEAHQPRVAYKENSVPVVKVVVKIAVK